MDSNFKNLKDKLNQPSELPNEFQWEHMEDGIYAKMDEINKLNAEKKKKRRRFFFILFMGFALIGTVLYQNFSAGDEGNQPESNSYAEIEEFNSNTSVEYNKTTTEGSSTSEQPKTLGNSEKEIQKNEQSSNMNQSANWFSNVKKNSLDDNAKSDLEARESIAGKIIQSDNQEKEIIESGLTPGDKTNETTRITGTKNQDIRMDKIAGLTPQILFPEDKKFKLNSGITLPIADNNPVDKIVRNSIIVSAGVSSWKFGYGTSRPERAQYEQNLLSYTAQIHYEHFIHNNWFVVTGLNYQQLESRLDWSGEVDNYLITLENVILEKQTNALTGKTEEITGNLNIPVKAQRSVRHYNQYKLLQIPLGAGITYKLGSVQWSIIAGPSINIIGSSRGRLVEAGQIIDFDKSDNNYFNPDWKLNGFIDGRLDYSINKDWDLSLTMGYQQSLSDWSSETGIEMHPRLFHTQIGLKYRL